MKNDRTFLLSPEAVRFEGVLDRALRAVESGLFLRVSFRAAADYFRHTLDTFAAGEFWGKLMRAACVIAAYTGSPALHRVVDEAAADMMSIQAADGCLSTAPRSSQPNGSGGADLWERKYVLLGMYAYWELTGSQKALECMTRLADYTAAQVGAFPKTPITSTGWAFCGIESSSILEPVMKLYHLTGKQEYLALGRHIVEETGACARENIFTAIENGKSPWEVGSNGNPHESIAKAYEMMSCFEGLMEYYRATGEERWLKIAKLFVEKVCREEITLLGSGGADAPHNLGPGTGEQWNKTAAEQTNPAIEKMMETCVTITYMKMLAQLFRLTADPTLIDRLEVSLYNALLGAMKTDGSYFDYFPKFNGTRSTEVNFSYELDGIPLSCCTANGPAGLALVPRIAVTTDAAGGVYFNLYSALEAEAAGFRFRVSTAYPYDGTVTIAILAAPDEPRALHFRIPGWLAGQANEAGLPAVRLYSGTISPEKENGGTPAELLPAVPGAWCEATRIWQPGERIELQFPIHPVVHPAPHGSDRAGDPYVLVTAGPIVLARDIRFDENIDHLVSGKGASFTREPSGESCACCWRMESEGCVPVRLIDYASAGITWDENSRYACWLRTDEAEKSGE